MVQLGEKLERGPAAAVGTCPQTEGPAAGGPRTVTMMLKLRRPRLRLFVFYHREKWRDLCFHQDRVGSFVPTVMNLFPTMSTLTAVNTPPCSQRFITEPSSRSETLWGGRRAPGLKHGSAGTQMSERELSTSARALQYDLKPDVPKCEGRKLFFDTHAVVRLLEENDFTTQQAEVMVKVLEIMLQRVMSQIAAVKKDMIILEKSEFSTLLAENEKLKIELLQLKVQLSDVMNKVRSDTILDMNLEKSRVKELKVEHEKKLLETRTEIMEMTAEQDRHLTQTNMKIDTEVAGLKTMLESHKLDTIKYLAGSVFTCLTVVLGFYRIWM
ncbi:mitochondrial calcium uniporter regulator 1 isoform X2 [Trachinotus anak]|uniref:mitochondrial calcium uniporter regulator 1 isoform X2 n=1 Tax=Trachinotus anak TaxID=443729 RepID=UPI0039F1E03E